MNTILLVNILSRLSPTQRWPVPYVARIRGRTTCSETPSIRSNDLHNVLQEFRAYASRVAEPKVLISRFFHLHMNPQTHLLPFSEMATSTPSTLTTDQIDDLLYLARVGATTDLKTAIDHLAKHLSTTPTTILAAAVDKDSGNGLLHMAAANGHTGKNSINRNHICISHTDPPQICVARRIRGIYFYRIDC